MRQHNLSTLSFFAVHAARLAREPVKGWQMERVLSAESCPYRFPLQAARPGPGNIFIHIIDHQSVVIWKPHNLGVCSDCPPLWHTWSFLISMFWVRLRIMTFQKVYGIKQQLRGPWTVTATVPHCEVAERRPDHNPSRACRVVLGMQCWSAGSIHNVCADWNINSHWMDWH